MAGRSAKKGRLAALTALWRALRSGRTGEAGLGERLRAVPRLVGATLRGEYDGITRGRLAVLALGVVYVISPIDLIPEGILPLIGLADDSGVVAWLAGSLLGDTDRFLSWERERQRQQRAADPRVVPGNVVR